MKITKNDLHVDVKNAKSSGEYDAITIELKSYDNDEVYENFEDVVKELVSETEWDVISIDFDEAGNGEPFATVTKDA